MSERIVRAALLGTGREPLPSDESTLVPAAGLSAERRLLLLAGIEAVRRRAGYRPAQRADAPPPAQAETRPPCTEVVLQLLADLLVIANEPLLLEAASLLDAAGERVRPELLASLLSVTDPRLRKAFLPVLGERARWLSGFRGDWNWARGPERVQTGGPVWTEGTFAERLALLERLRDENPAAARALVESSWKEEKAEHRAALVEQLARGLGPADEPFLESALDDRSAQVRAAAAPLLARIEGSALAARMEARAGALLQLSPRRGGLLGALGGRSLRIEVKVPSELDEAWQRDGIPLKPPQGVGAKSFWLTRTLALVRPGNLERRFSASAAEIVSAVARADESLPVLQGLTQAALLFGARKWAAPLWDAWLARKGDDAVIQDALRKLLPAMDPAEAAARVEPLFTQTSEQIGLAEALSLLPQPWTADFSLRVVAAVRATARDPDVAAWSVAAYSVARAAIPELGAALERPGEEPLPARDERAIDEAREVLRVRRILHDQIPAPERRNA